MTMIKRGLCLLLTLALALGCLAGCGKGDIASVEAASSPNASPDASANPAAAKGRYVEQSIPLPEGKYLRDMVMLDSGKLRVSMTRADDTAFIATQGGALGDWDIQEVPQEILDCGKCSVLALSPDGTVFCATWREVVENEKYEYHFWVIDPDSTCREIPNTYPDFDETQGFYTPSCDFTNSGRLMVQFYFSDIREVDLKTGELGENINEVERSIMKMGCAGEDTYMAGWDTASANISGQTAALDGAMGQALIADLKANEGNTPRFTYWQNPDGYVFFTTTQGLYSYIPGGSIIEELVSGAHSTLGDPMFCPTALTGGADGSFYVLGDRTGEESMLLRYVYDTEMPTVADTQLKIFMLYQDEDMPQMVSQYQVAHPEVTIDLEIGLTGENGVTEADALRTLNTEILAGNGPDLICMDGFNLDAYLEKGILADLSGVLSQAEPTLEQVTRCYEADGKVCAMPTSFALPAMYGPSHIVSQIHDWDSLVAAGEQVKAERTDARGVLAAFIPVSTADDFYDTFVNAWLRPDGTVDEGKLTEYYAGVKKVYGLDAELQAMAGDRVYEEPPFAPGEYTGFNGSVLMLPGNFCMSFGTLDGMESWANRLDADSMLDSYETARLELGGSGIFVPRGIMGILADTPNPQAAEAFLTFMLSEAAQSKDLTYSFPVNKAVFDKETGEDRVIDSWSSFSDENGNPMSFQAQWPDEEDREKLRGWVDALTTPASTDRTIRKMVMAQMNDCLFGKITPEEASRKAMQTLELYLAE